MKRQELRVGMRVKLLGQEYLIEQRLPNGQLLLKHFVSGTSSVKSESEIVKALSRGEGEVLGSSYEGDEARYGTRIAGVRKRINQTAVIPTRRLDRPQIDHTTLDLVVIDEKASAPISRPWLEIHICPLTRRVLAFKVVQDHPPIKTRRSV